MKLRQFLCFHSDKNNLTFLMLYYGTLPVIGYSRLERQYGS